MFLFILLSVLFFFIVRVIYVLIISYPSLRKYFRVKFAQNKKSCDNKVKIVVVLGSGGHTTEILLVVSRLDPMKYNKHYIIASTDKRSYDKVVQTESCLKQSEYEVFYIPRSREVHQSFFTSVFTTLNSIFVSLPLMFRIRPDLVLCNGPGTCVPICLITVLLKVFYLCNAKIIFIESICRVRSLSLSGKILRYFTDEFLVQWPELKEKYPDVEYIGRL